MARTGGDGAGRSAGMTVFVLGVLLLLAVFGLAYVQLVASGALAESVAARSMGDTILMVASKGLFLFLLGFIASAVANKGIALYQAAMITRDDD